MDRGRAILIRTPDDLNFFLTDLDPVWTKNNESPENWSPHDIVGHIVLGDKTDQMIRTSVTLENGMEETFVPFDRSAQFEESKGKYLNEQSDEFEDLPVQSIKELDGLDLKKEQLDMSSKHPDLGGCFIAPITRNLGGSRPGPHQPNFKSDGETV